MKLSVDEARRLCMEILKGLGLDEHDSEVITDHLVDGSLRGVAMGGLPRLLMIAAHLEKSGKNCRPVKVIHETPISASIDGGNNIGFIVGHRAARLAIDKAKHQGVGIVGANNTFVTGNFSYYMEMATREDLVVMAAGNSMASVAPNGATEAILGTNPIAFGFPSTGDPVIWDIGTSSMTHGVMEMYKRLNKELPQGVAMDREGNPTRNPAEALQGAVHAWGGHKGSGLSIVVQLLGMLCDTAPVLKDLGGFGFFIIAMRPDLLMPAEVFKKRVAELSTEIRGARPEKTGLSARMPFERSAEERRRRLKEGIDLPDANYQALVTLCERK
ncbi:Ldh family oxidoreductase [Thermodesulfobacteriota bacterium]